MLRYFMIFIFAASASASASEDLAVWKKIDKINKTLGAKGKMPPAFDVFQEQFEAATRILFDDELEKQYQAVREKAMESDDFREATKIKERAKPAFIIEFTGDSDTKLMDYGYFYSKTNEGSNAREFMSAYRHYHEGGEVDVSKPGLDANKCFFDMDPSRVTTWSDESKGKRKTASRTEVKKKLAAVHAKLPDGFLKRKAQDFLECMEKSGAKKSKRVGGG